jgi:hypothetical protein
VRACISTALANARVCVTRVGNLTHIARYYCQLGSFDDTTNNKCAQCAIGTATSTPGTVMVCPDCTPGTFAAAIGSKGCLACREGACAVCARVRVRLIACVRHGEQCDQSEHVSGVSRWRRGARARVCVRVLR